MESTKRQASSPKLQTLEIQHHNPIPPLFHQPSHNGPKEIHRNHSSNMAVMLFELQVVHCVPTVAIMDMNHGITKPAVQMQVVHMSYDICSNFLTQIPTGATSSHFPQPGHGKSIRPQGLVIHHVQLGPASTSSPSWSMCKHLLLR